MTDKPKFTAEDLQRAHDRLRPQIERLVERFGAAQAFELVDGIRRELTPYGGPNEPPQFYWLDAPGGKSWQSGED